MKVSSLSNRRVRACSRRYRFVSGFSLVEMIVAVGIMGVMATVGVAAFKKINQKSRETVAHSVAEKLNKAVHDYNHAYKPLDTPFLATSAGDEEAVLLTLQYRDPNPAVGEPYMRPDWKPALTNDTTEYRYIWRGRTWDVLVPGESGAGLKVQFDGTDIGELVVFPPSYVRFGS